MAVYSRAYWTGCSDTVNIGATLFWDILAIQTHIRTPRREAGDVSFVWNLRAVIWLHVLSPLLFFCLVLLHFLSYLFSACWSILLNFFQKILQHFSLRDRLFCMAPVQQLGEVSWSVVCAACCHMALVFAVMHLYTIYHYYYHYYYFCCQDWFSDFVVFRWFVVWWLACRVIRRQTEHCFLALM